MIRAWLFLVVAAGLFSAMLNRAPGGTSSDAFKGEKAYQEKVLREGYESRSEPMSGTIELTRESDGHFYANVDINGTPTRVLVDTGASGIALSRDDAQRAGLAVSAGMYEVIGEGAGGEIHGEFVTLDSVSLGSATANQVPAVILDGGATSLLGQSFLKRFDSVEIRGDTMVLR